ncbi:hypothetical protein ABEX47_22580 [Paenibacillus ehimensis]|uniref:hypothetical protein n=1 Tax=Paenibacillus ehimensis TaxID=79264 RepID=UPI003D2B4B9F
MAKNMVRGLFLLFLLIFTGCSEKKDVTLTATSAEWNIEIFYKVVEGKYQEIPSIQYIGKKPIGPEITLDIIYTNYSVTTNTLSGLDYLGMEMKKLKTRTVLKDWKDVETIKITWNNAEGNFEDTLIPKPKQTGNSNQKPTPL